MFAPIAVISEWGDGINFLVAFLIGIGFGFAVERGGMGNARKLAMQFYFRDMSVFKIMFTAIITAMFGIILLSSIGWLNVDVMLINPTYLWTGLTGGLIMGFGFILSGY